MTANPEFATDTADDPTSRDDTLRRAVRLAVVQELADEMAHDLNNVLTVIAGSLQLVLMQQEGGEPSEHHFVRHALEAAQRGAQMTGSLLAFASPQVVDVQTCNLVDVVESVAPQLREALGLPTALEIIVPSRPSAAQWVVADRRYIERALLALGAMMVAKSGGSAQVPCQMTLRLDSLSARDAVLKSGAVQGGRAYVQLSVRCLAPGLSIDTVRQVMTPGFGSAPVDRAALDLRAAYASVRQCDGDISIAPLRATYCNGFVVAILLPAATPV
jgi:nitrogen-specific signal transduction histidine kinase